MTGPRPPAPRTTPAAGPATCAAAAELTRAALEQLLHPAPDAILAIPPDVRHVEVARILRSAAHLLAPPPPRTPAGPRPGWVHVDDVAAIAAILRAPLPAAPPPPTDETSRDPAPAARSAAHPSAADGRPLRRIDPHRPTPADLASHRPPR